MRITSPRTHSARVSFWIQSWNSRNVILFGGRFPPGRGSEGARGEERRAVARTSERRVGRVAAMSRVPHERSRGDPGPGYRIRVIPAREDPHPIATSADRFALERGCGEI